MACMPYLVLSDFWHKSVLVEAGAVVTMSASEAKYFAHAVMPQPAEIDAASEPEPEPVPVEAPEETKAAIIEVVEKVRRRKADGDGAQA